MKKEQLLGFLLWTSREVARLHASNAALHAVVEEMRIIEPRLDRIDALEVQKDAWHAYLKKVEDFDPEIAALIDNRTPEAF